MPRASRLWTRTMRNIYLMHFMNASRLFPKVRTTIMMKKTTERYCIGFFSFCATFGRYCEQSIPSTSGMPRRMTIVLKISQKGIESSGMARSCFSANLR